MVDALVENINTNQIDQVDAVEESSAICEALDEHTVEYIECYGQLLFYHDLLDQCLNEGFLNMSKARSLIGCVNLSMLQIPSELSADVHVAVKYKTNERDPSFGYASFEMLDNEEENGDTSKKFPKWFGVLAPLSLKTSHKSFCKSIDIIGKLCEQQSRLKSIEKVLEHLTAKKLALKNKKNEQL
jgi:hypothetical protein